MGAAHLYHLHIEASYQASLLAMLGAVPVMLRLDFAVI